MISPVRFQKYVTPHNAHTRVAHRAAFETQIPTEVLRQNPSRSPVMGHRNIMHTVRYTELRSDRFDGFWKD